MSYPHHVLGQDRKTNKNVFPGRPRDPNVRTMHADCTVNAAQAALLICPACSSRSTARRPVEHESIATDFSQNPTAEKSLLSVEGSKCADCGSAQEHRCNAAPNTPRPVADGQPRQGPASRVRKRVARVALVAASLPGRAHGPHSVAGDR